MLPPDLKFTKDNSVQPKECQGFLRQRFNACKTIIWRPYLDIVLRDEETEEEEVWDGVWKCISACVDAIVNLRGFGQTVLVDTWICALS